MTRNHFLSIVHLFYCFNCQCSTILTFSQPRSENFCSFLITIIFETRPKESKLLETDSLIILDSKFLDQTIPPASLVLSYRISTINKKSNQIILKIMPRFLNNQLITFFQLLLAQKIDNISYSELHNFIFQCKYY